MKNCTGIFCPMQYGKVDPATCQAVDYCPQATPPRTNGDRIRAMTDEELAEYLFIKTCEDGFPQFTTKNDWLGWLKKEAEEARE